MQIKLDQRQVEETRVLLRGLALDGPKVLSRSLNKTATKGRQRSSEEIRKQVALKAGYVKSKLAVKRATFKRLQAKLTAAKRGVLMTRYQHSQLKSGDYSVKIKRKGARKRLRGAFKTNVYAGGKKVDVLAFRGDGFYRTGNRRMNVLYAPSVSQVFNTVRNRVDAEMATFLLAETERQIATALRGY